MIVLFAAIVLIVIILGSLVLSIFFTKHGATPPFFQEKLGWRIATQGIWLALLIVFVGIPLMIALINIPHAMNPDSWSMLFQNAITLSLLVPVAALLWARGNLDFSIAAVASTSGMIVASFATRGSPAFGVAAGLGFAFVIGLVNALIVSLTRLSSVLVTLATGTLCVGIGRLVSDDGRIMSTESNFRVLGNSAAIWWILIIVAAAVVIFLAEFTPMGRMTKTLPWQESIPQRLLWTGIPFLLMALAAGFTGFYRLTRFRIADPYSGIDMSLLVQCLLAVVLGGTVFRGRNVAVVGGLIAAFFITLIEFLLIFANARRDYFLLPTGILLLAFGLLSLQFHNLVAWFYHRRQSKLPQGFPVSAAAPAAIQDP